jgi:hypothetical protein
MAAQMLLPFALSACCTTDGTCGREDIISTLNNAISAASAAVGAASVAVGLKAGDASLANSGGQLLSQAAKMLEPGDSGSASPPASANPPQAAGEPPPAGPQCVAYLRTQRLGYMRAAARCQVNEQFMASIQNEEASPLPDIQCGGSFNSIDQRIAQQACGRVYACATLAYTAALVPAKQGADCPTSVNAGLARYPIPKVQ